MQLTLSTCPLSTAILLAEAQSKSKMVPPKDAEAMVFPSGLKATHIPLLLCAAISFVEARSQSRMVLSREPEAMVFPSGLKATEMTTSLCPLSTSID